MKSLTPSDYVLIIIILAGILLAVLVDVIAVQIIGGGLAIIFAVGLFMIVAQRQREFVDSSNKSNKPSSPSYNVTVKKDNNATRQTFENFMDSKNSENENIEETDFSSSEISGDEGFRIIKKKKKPETNEEPIIDKDETAKVISDDKIHIKPKVKEKEEISGKIDDTKNDKFEENIIDIEQKIDEQSQPESSEEKNKVDVSEEISEQSEIPEKEAIYLDNLMEDPPKSDEPRMEFEYCVSRLLVSIRAVSSTRSALFFLMNNAKDEIKLEAYATDVPKKLNKKVRFQIGNDIISSILKSEKPEIVTEIKSESEKELLPYYNESAEIKSFIGVPVYYEKNVIGVLCADSPLSDAYDSVMVNFLAQLNTLITTLLGSYIEKYDLLQAYKSLEAINLFRQKQASEDKDIMWALLEAISNIVEYDSIGIVVWNEEVSKWFCGAEIGVTDHPLIKDLIMDESSIVNKALTNKETLIANLEKKNEILISSDENIEEINWVAAIPVATQNAVFGALVLLNRELPDGEEDLNLTKTLCDFAANSIEKVQLFDMLSQNSLYDFDTGLMNRAAFEDSLKKEFQRAKENDRMLSICLINIDKYASFEPGVYQKRMEAMIYHVIKITNDAKKPYDVFGKADDKLFGVVLAEKDAEKAKMWAEKLRSEIATSMINFESKKFNVTVSIGVASISSADSPDDILNNALQALKISLEKTNFVSLFS